MSTFLTLLTIVALGDVTVAAAGTTSRQALDPPQSPATAVAMQLYAHECELSRIRTLYRDAHPALAAKQQEVRTIRVALLRIVQEGHKVDRQQLISQLNAHLQQLRLNLALAQQQLSAAHPRLAMLELQLQIELQVQQRLLSELPQPGS